MQIKIGAADVAVTDAMREDIERRLYFALSRFGEEVRCVTVHVSTLQDPECGDRMGCHIEVTIAPRGTVVTKNAAAELSVAIERATGRSGRAVGRALRHGRPPSPP